MIADISRVIAQLSDPKLLRPVLLGLIASALVMAGLVAFFVWLLSDISVSSGGSWWEDILQWAVQIFGTFGAAAMAFLLFPAFALTIQSLFLDSVTDAVEDKHYPHLGRGREVPLIEGLIAAIKLTLIVIVVNVVLLPVYIILLPVAGAGLALYYAVNGYLVGREFFEVVGLRRQNAKDLRVTRRGNRFSVWLDGILLVLLFTIPIVNLAGPTLGTAYMVHRYHRVKAA
jgi:uncharacterized protein involved in cysteine biosynthesis